MFNVNFDKDIIRIIIIKRGVGMSETVYNEQRETLKQKTYL